jgi:cysteinyl-tRNA synthetase
MAKSSNNVVLVSDLIAKKLDPLALRLCFLENRYRSQMDLSWDSLKAAHQLIQRWREKISVWKLNGSTVNAESDSWVSQITADLCDDLDTPRALQKLRNIEKSQSISDGVKFAIFSEIDVLFGLDLLNSSLKSEELPAHLNEMLIQRQKARSSGDFTESDRLRDLLAENGISVNDGKDGQNWNWLVSD